MMDTSNRLGVLGRLGVFPLVRLSLAGRRILAYLAVRGEPVARGAAAGELWADSPEESARANLRRALWQLPTGWVVAEGEDLALRALTDLSRAKQVASRAMKGDCLGFDEIELLSQDVLPGWNEEWLVPAADAFHLLRVQALEAACRSLMTAGDLVLATQAGSAALAAEPLRESAAEALIEAHLAQRNRYEAVQCFRSLKKRLHTELGVAPDPVLARRVQRICGT
jgi:DNA-binding SARP family transcriptional activator